MSEPVSTNPLASFLPMGRDPRAHVRARWASLTVGIGCTGAAWTSAGTEGLAAGVIATALVVGFFWSGMIPLLIVRGRDASAVAGLGIVLITYSLRLAVVLLVLGLSRSWDFADGFWIGVTIIACALTWITVQVVSTMRRQQPETRSTSAEDAPSPSAAPDR